MSDNCEKVRLEKFSKLLEVCDRLLSEDGCPWDKKQTLFTLCPYMQEELCELIEAIEMKDKNHIVEEAGDLFYILIFLAKIGEIHHGFSIVDILEKGAEKMIRRHPHIFSGKKAITSEEVVKQWQKIKKEEKNENAQEKRKEKTIPKGLPLLVKALKIARMQRENMADRCDIECKGSIDNKSLSEEERLGEKLYKLVQEADKKGINPEAALRLVLDKKVPEST